MSRTHIDPSLIMKPQAETTSAFQELATFVPSALIETMMRMKLAEDEAELNNDKTVPFPEGTEAAVRAMGDTSAEGAALLSLVRELETTTVADFAAQNRPDAKAVEEQIRNTVEAARLAFAYAWAETLRTARLLTKGNKKTRLDGRLLPRRQAPGHAKGWGLVTWEQGVARSLAEYIRPDDVPRLIDAFAVRMNGALRGDGARYVITPKLIIQRDHWSCYVAPVFTPVSP